MNHSHPQLIGVFYTKIAAENGFLHAVECGYGPKEINIIMSEDCMSKSFKTPALPNINTQPIEPNVVTEGLQGGVLGGTLGGIVGGLIVLGANMIMPGLCT